MSKIHHITSNHGELSSYSNYSDITVAFYKHRDITERYSNEYFDIDQEYSNWIRRMDSDGYYWSTKEMNGNIIFGSLFINEEVYFRQDRKNFFWEATPKDIDTLFQEFKQNVKREESLKDLLK